MARVYIGTSGWNYDVWKDGFYAGLPRKQWLAHCAEAFTGIEVNATFYRLQTTATFRKWRQATPADFAFCLKGHRYLTHRLALRNVQPENIRRCREGTEALGDRLEVVVWQLPASRRKDIDGLEHFLKQLRFWRKPRHAVELRHTSWFDDETVACLARHDVTNCISDAADWPRWDAVTTNLIYVRLHGHTRTYASAYRGDHLARWADRIARWKSESRDVHVYFDNDMEGAAPRDALTLRRLTGC